MMFFSARLSLEWVSIFDLAYLLNKACQTWVMLYPISTGWEYWMDWFSDVLCKHLNDFLTKIMSNKIKGNNLLVRKCVSHKLLMIPILTELVWAAFNLVQSAVLSRLFNVGGLKRREGREVWWKKRKTMNTMSSSCSRGESLQFPVLIPPDALCALIYILEKKKNSTQLPVEGPSAAAQHALANNVDSRLNSPMIALQVEKRQRNILHRPRGDAACQERAEEFSNPYQNTQQCPPLTSVCEHHAMGSALINCWQLEKQRCVCVYLCTWMFRYCLTAF